MTNRTLIAALALAAVLGFALGGSFVSSLNQAKPSYQAHPAASDNKHDVTGHPRPEVFTQEQSGGGHGEGKWYDTFLNHMPDWFVALFTLLLVYVTHRLVTSTNKLWEAGERQIAAAERSADAARGSAEAAQRTLTELERPYLFIFQVGPLMEDPTGGWFVEYTIANYGKTPAIVMETAAAIVQWERGEPGAPNLMLDDFPMNMAPFVAAGETRRLREYIPTRVITDGMEVLFDNIDDPQSASRQIPVLYKAREGVFFRATVSYTGAHTGEYETACLWRYMTHGIFAIRGGPEYNYQR